MGGTIQRGPGIGGWGEVMELNHPVQVFVPWTHLGIECNLHGKLGRHTSQRSRWRIFYLLRELASEGSDSVSMGEPPDAK